MKGDEKTDIRKRNYSFALKVIELIRLVPKSTVGYVLSKQLIRSGTSIGANVEEAQGVSSRKDFINKINIAKKEARETKYWLNLMADSEILKKDNITVLIDECASITNILTAIVKTALSKK
ncbi:MAG: four helix bundle protein [Candidatus Omnitrophota bacterium]